MLLEKIIKVGLRMKTKRSWMIAVLFIAFLMGLAGCSEKTEKEEAIEKNISERDQQKTPKKNEQKETQKEVEPRVIEVKVVDPNNQTVLRLIKPSEMGFGTDDALYKEELKKWARELAKGTDTTPGYDQRNVPDRIGADGQIIKGTPLVVLEEEELVNRIISASKKGGTVELPLTVQVSGYAPEDAAYLHEVVIASYTTHFNPAVTGRNKNIELSAGAIHNVIVGVNDYFSFNTTVGPSDEAHGYQPAQEAVNGKLVMGIGGGICQTSSTLYNAVDQIGVNYVEKHHHSVTVGYVPSGRDATVSYGGLDFRFQNTTGAPFLISTIYHANGTLTVEIKTSAQYAGVVKRAV